MSESEQISNIDNMGREKFWEDIGSPENDGLALKMFQEQCCEECLCNKNNKKGGYNIAMTNESSIQEL